ncbi:MAG: TRAM domain-containing protein [Synergistaceae bacterium]|jgi:uncharacterized protein YacL|nr:TRAM domain-containing protein [Synergistaceae bacterium]
MAEGFGRILKAGTRILFSLLGGVAGYQVAQILLRQGWWKGVSMSHIVAINLLFIGSLSLVGFILSIYFVKALVFIGTFSERQLQSTSWHDLSVSVIGLIVGLLVANLIALPFSGLPAVGSYIAVLLNLTLGYLGVRIFSRRRDEILNMWSSLGGLKGKLVFRGKKGKQAQSQGQEDLFLEENRETPPKILDTSVIIDGRILDIAKAGFLEGPIVLPRFVLTELQSVADSTDPIKRSRGRRGFDVVSELQKLKEVQVQVLEVTLKDLGLEAVDEALLALAKQAGGKILTTDYNLNMRAQVEKVVVLNVNDLSNSLKPVLLPGESLTVDILREGKEPNQGVGYLEDGTMIVVEDGQRHIGRRVEVFVTSLLQTSAGRMIFGRFVREVQR